MKTAFTSGTRVRFNIPDGGLAEITDYKKSFDWRIPGYLGEGFYHVRTIPEQRLLIAHEDDLTLAKPVIPNCPNCNGERELSGTGGYTCFFCGMETKA